MHASSLAGMRPLALALLLAGTSAQAVAAADVTLGPLAIDAGPARYVINSLSVRGTDQSRAEIEAIFDTRASEPLAVRLARLSAREVAAPELRIEQTVAGSRQTTIYRDIVMSDVRKGVIAAGRAAGGSGSIAREGKPAQTTAMGQMTIEAVDLPAIARVFTEARKDDKAPALLLYKSFAASDMKVSGGDQPEVTVARISGKDIALRPTPVPIMGLMEKFATLKDKGGGPPDFDVVANALDLLDGFEVGLIEMSGMTIRDLPSKDAPDRKGTGSGTIGRIALTLPPSGPSSFRFEGLDITTPEGRVKLGALKFDGFSLKPTLKGLKEWLAKPPPARGEPEFGKLIPTLGALRFENIEVEPKANTGTVALKGLEFAFADPLDGVPTSGRIAFDRLSGSLQAAKDDKNVKDLIAMGYTALDVSAALDTAWNGEAKKLALKALEFSGVDMFDFRSKGTVANLPREAFSTDKAVAQVAWLGATVTDLDLSLSNKGLFERLLAHEARKVGRSPEDLRRDWGMMVMLGASAVLGDSEGAKTLAGAVSKFVAKPGRLSISLKSRNPSGLGLADVIAAGDPKAVFQKIDVQATAE